MKTKDLFLKAKMVRENAYAPYSKFKVGAAILGGDGNVYLGCNFENASFPAGTCAERAAIAALVSAGGSNFSEIVIVTGTKTVGSPCGICRQVLSEFALDQVHTKIHLGNLSGIQKSYSIGELLPDPFNPKALSDGKNKPF